jgi:lipoprotein-anchoring transpeptidase ErfK/SrfK
MDELAKRDRYRLIVDKSRNVLHILDNARNGETIDSFAVSTGMNYEDKGCSGITEPGIYKVGDIVESWDMKWDRDPSIKHPYGTHLAYLYQLQDGEWKDTNKALHGTGRPHLVGTNSTHGCISTYNWRMLQLVEQYIETGTILEVKENMNEQNKPQVNT